MAKDNKNKEKKENLKWFITVCISTFILSLFFSYISTTAISNLSIVPAIILLFAVIFIGILFDIIGVAVTVAKEEHFHAMATKKIEGSKLAIKLIRNSAKVSNFCADVIGDICGVLSGAVGAIIAMKLTQDYGMDQNVQFVVSALVASVTVGGKALGKSIAQKNSTQIVHLVSKIF